MFPVSEKFMHAIRQNTRKYKWHGELTTTNGKTYKFGPEDMVKGSGYIKWQCCGGSEIELGTVYAAEMGVTLFSQIDRYTLYEAVIKIYFTLYYEDGLEETIPMGIFEVSEANRNIKTIELKAYDYMLRFDKELKLESSSGTPYQFLKVACDACKVELGQTVSEINAFPNGTTTLGIYADNDIESFRDLIYYVAQSMGCFCQIDRYGRLVLKTYENKEALTIPQKERFDSSYSDFVTRYTAVSSTNQISQTSEYVAMETDDGLTMNLGINPLMQFGLKDVREKKLRAILEALQKVNYVPFDSTTIGNPALEPGDVLKFTGGQADETKYSCITSVEYKFFGKSALKCVGKNPRMATAKSKNEKNITGLINSVESGKTIIYNFVNVSPFTIGQSLTKVMDIDFTATEETSASFQCEMLLEVLKPELAEGEELPEELPELSIVYKINDETIDQFMPTKTCMYGKHIVTLFYPLSKVIENSANTFSMYLKLSSSSLTIGETQIRATISGQGLAAGLGDWNGRININENIGQVAISEAPYVIDAMADTVSVIFPVKKTPSLTQNIGNIQITEHAYTIDGLVDRIWVTEILRTFVMTIVRGNPRYSGYVAINANDQFVLRNRYKLDSGPKSIDAGYAEKLTIDTAFLASVDSIEVSGCNVGYRVQLLVNTSNMDVKINENIDNTKGRFELVASATKDLVSEEVAIDEGFLESLLIDVSGLEGVKGVEFSI